MEVDDVLQAAGGLGSYQKKVLFVYCLLKIYLGTQLVQNVFVGAIPEISCRGSELDGCDANCPETVVASSIYSIASEWKLLCGADASAAKSVQAFFMAGIMIGSFLFGQVSDAIGRRPVLLGATTASAALAVASSYAPNYEVYLALRFCTAVFLGGKVVAGFVLMSELVGPSKRGLVGTAPAAFFAFGICCLALIAYATRQWRDVSFWTGVLGITALPPAYMVVCESPRWLLRAGRTEECLDVLRRIATSNGCCLTSAQLKLPEASNVTAAKSRHALVDLFHHPHLRKLTFVQLYAWFANSTVYYGLTMAAGSVGSNMYISVALSGMVEVPSNFICLKLMNHPRLGRRQTLYWSMLCSGCACLLAYLLPAGFGVINITYLTLIGKVFITISFAVVHVQSSELFPTGVRNTSLGVLSVANRLGGIAAPLALYLDGHRQGLQFLSFGLLAATSGFLTGMLPETLNKRLPESAEDLSNI